MAELMDAFGLDETAKPVSPEIEQFGTVGQHAGEQVDRRLGQHQLASVGATGDPSATIDRAAEIVAVAQRCGAGVQPDAHPQLHAHCRVEHRPLDLERGGDSIVGRGERNGEAVARSGEDVAIVGVDDGADPSIVFGESVGHRIGEPIPERGGSLDVSEQERHVPHRRCTHHVCHFIRLV